MADNELIFTLLQPRISAVVKRPRYTPYREENRDFRSSSAAHAVPLLLRQRNN
jgi:hypothetical protein